eukprot:TRINITY_DN9502_c0_g1_i3.p1 TRINITY_DN9502_c0_g1~~TRINITY_DN9502_c0_g1_i3.p1  ORF type:complete len:115 (-),score=21.92 TRINITY_DN9502_c0_g1_i3:619-963(-)
MVRRGLRNQPLPRLGEVISPRKLQPINTGSVPARFCDEGSIGVTWMKASKNPPQGLVFRKYEMNAARKTAVNTSAPEFFQIDAVNSQSVPEPPTWDCITKPIRLDRMSADKVRI